MTGPLVLALDTATVVTVGIARGEEFLAGDVVDDRLAQVEQLMPTVVRVAAQAGVRLAELDRIVVGLGPGPFTGLRVGVATAQILATTIGVPLHGICTLDVIAAEYARSGSGAGFPHLELPSGEFLVATDARRKELYWARYAADGSRLAGPLVEHPDQLPALPAVGPGAELYPQLNAVPGPRRLDPRTLAVLGPDLPDAGQTPLYLRRPDAAVPARRKSVLLRRPDRVRGPR